MQISPWSPHGIKYVYLAKASIAVLHTAFVALLLPETLEVSQRAPRRLTTDMANPLGFLRIFTEGTVALRKLVAITTLQMSFASVRENVSKSS